MKQSIVVVLAVVVAGAAAGSWGQKPDTAAAKSLSGADTARQVAPGRPAAPAADVPAERDTVLIIRARGAAGRDTLTDVAVEERIESVISKTSKTVEKTRRQGYGIGGGFTPGVAWLHMAPVNDLVAHEPLLSNKRFADLSNGYEMVMLTGGMGYGGVGNGVRIGGGGWGGSVKFTSDPYRAAGDTTDSAAVIAVHLGYGGVLLEKATIKDNLNLLFGGIWVFGSINVTPDFYKVGGPSSFTTINEGTGNQVSAAASFTGLELHAGGTYTVFPWFHLGLDVNALFLTSLKGFAARGSNAFLMAVPGGRIRIVFGNLG